MDELLRDFLTETIESLDHVDSQIVRLEREPDNSQVLSNIFRLVHTIKGTCGFLGLPRLEALTHAAETLMGKFRDGMPVSGEAVTLILGTLDRIKTILDGLEKLKREPEGDDSDLIRQLSKIAQPQTRVVQRALQSRRSERGEPPPMRVDAEEPDAATIGNGALGDADGKLASRSLRVSIDRLDQLMTMASELVLTRNQLLEVLRRHDDSEFKVPLQRLSNVTTEVQQAVMTTRMQPIGNAWQKLPRVVRDLALELGKEIELQMDGAETELDRQVLDLVKDPLTHLVRNCADHGIESPAERSAAGKACKGMIRLSACRQGGHILIEIADDGRGLDTALIKDRAVQLGLVSEADMAAKSEAEINNFIFTAGFSTANEVTSISGRGVGMDVVRSNIGQIGGTVAVTSIGGRGTSFVIKIPLTLAIVAALIVEVAGERFAFPQLSVLEIVRIGDTHRVQRINDAPVLRLRQMLLPLLHAREVLRLGSGDDRQGFVIVTQAGSLTFGVVVDNVFHTEEIVVKPISAKLRHIAIFSGVTILGDGSVIIVLDPNALAQTFGRGAQSPRVYSAESAEPPESPQPDTTSLLLFRCKSQRRKGVPLSAIIRIEEIDCSKIEAVNGRFLVQYRDQLMPLFGIDAQSAVKQQGAQSVLVFSDGDCPLGLAIDDIIDVVDEKLDIKLADDCPGTLGYAVVRGNTTEIIDLGNLVSLGCETAPDQPTSAGNPFRPAISSGQALETINQAGK